MKKTKWQSIIVFALIAVMALGMLTACGEKTDSSGNVIDNNTSAAVSGNTPVADSTKAPVATAPAPTAPATEAPTEANATEATSSSKNSPEAVCSLIETTIKKNFDYCKVTGDGKEFTIAIAKNGLTASVATMKKAGYDETQPNWAKARDSMVNLHSSLAKLIGTMGYEDAKVTLFLANDTNTDKVLLAIVDGVVVYDVMAD